MRITNTPFQGLLTISPDVFGDSRGYFFESYNEKIFFENGINMKFVQDNQSFSRKGVIRGLHYQKPPFAQTKLVRVLAGAIQDVVIDLRKDQPTFGKEFSLELSAENKLQLLVPKGFAHGFLVLSESAEVIYKCDEVYHRESESGIHCAKAGIPWRINPADCIVSEKDRVLPPFSYSDSPF